MHVRRKKISSLSQRKSSEVSDGLAPCHVPGCKMPAARGVFLSEDLGSWMHEKQLQKTSIRRIDKMSWPDRLLFMAIAGCIFSAAGIIPQALSTVGVGFLFTCTLILTGLMLFWLLCPMSIKGVIAVLRFRADGAPEKREQADETESLHKQRVVIPDGVRTQALGNTNPALAGSTRIQTESTKMTEKPIHEPQNQSPAPKPALAMTDEQFAKAMFIKAWRNPTPKNTTK
jgi:hypothetical protein